MSSPLAAVAAVLVMLLLPGAAIALLAWRIRAKRRQADAYLARVRAVLDDAEWLGPTDFRRAGRVYRLEASVNPLLQSGLALRLSTFTDRVLEAEIRAARNVPTKTPQRLAEDAFYGRFVLDSPSPDEAVDYFLSAKEVVRRMLPDRWGAVSRLHSEVVLSANRSMPEDLGPDLAALAELAAVPVERRPRGGTWTIRTGFEPSPPAWHWKPGQRAAAPPGLRRWCVSCWYDNAYLNAASAALLWRLAGERPRAWVTAADDLDFLAHGFGVAPRRTGAVVELATPTMAVAADQWLDGEFFGGFVGGDATGVFDGAVKLAWLDRALAALPAWRLWARRLFDDEFSWFSGEIEILSCELTDDDVRRAFEELALEHRAEVREIDRPFSFKLLRDDRLELSL